MAMAAPTPFPALPLLFLDDADTAVTEACIHKMRAASVPVSVSSFSSEHETKGQARPSDNKSYCSRSRYLSETVNALMSATTP